MIANRNDPSGFRPIFHGGKREVRRVRRTVAAGRAGALAVGDAYEDDGTGNVKRADAVGDTILGIVDAIELAPITGSSNGPVSADILNATDAGAVIGIEDNDAEFEVQITTFAVPTDIGKTAAIVDAAPDTVRRNSTQSVVLDAVNKQFVVLGLKDSPADNAAGANARVIVRLNTTEQAPQ